MFSSCGHPPSARCDAELETTLTARRASGSRTTRSTAASRRCEGCRSRRLRASGQGRGLLGKAVASFRSRFDEASTRLRIWNRLIALSCRKECEQDASGYLGGDSAAVGAAHGVGVALVVLRSSVVSTLGRHLCSGLFACFLLMIRRAGAYSCAQGGVLGFWGDRKSVV